MPNQAGGPQDYWASIRKPGDGSLAEALAVQRGD